MQGWISIHRKLTEHWIWKNEKYLKTWLWFLIRANHKGKKILIGAEIIDIERGQFITSINNICKETNLTAQNVRTLLKLLENDSMINKQSTNKLTKITICNYDSYQDTQQTDNKLITNEQQTDNKRVTTDNNDNNENNDINNRIENFKKQVFEFSDKYSREMLIDFIAYWTEKNKSGKKLRFEGEKYFDMSRRLATWYKNSNKNKNQSNRIQHDSDFN